MTTTARDGVEVKYLTEEEAWALVDEAARRELDMSAREFLDAWNAGKFTDPDTPEIMRLVMLLPLISG